MLLILLGRGFQIILNLATMKIATTYLPLEEFGRTSLVQSLAAFFTLVAVNPVQMFVARRLHVWHEKGRLRSYLFLFASYILVTTGIAVLILSIFEQKLGLNMPFSKIWLGILVFGMATSLALNQAYIPTLNFLEKRTTFVVLNNATLLGALLLSIWLSSTFGFSAEWWVLGVIFSNAFGAIAGAMWLRRYSLKSVGSIELTQQWDRLQLRGLIIFGTPIALSVGFVWLQTQSYRFFVERALGLEVLARFVAGYGVATGVMAAAESVLLLYFQPRLYKRFSTEDLDVQSTAWNEFFNAIVPAVVLTGAFIVAVGPELTRFVLGPSLWDAHVFLIWGVLAETARILCGAYGFIAHAKMNTRLLILPNLMGAVVAIGISLALLPNGKVEYAGWALTLAGVAALTTMHLVLSRQIQVRLPTRRLIFALMESVAMVIAASLFRKGMDGLSPLLEASIVLSLVGVGFLVAQYYILRRFMHADA